MNSFGHILRLTTFGESHGPAIGGVLDGVPAGIVIDRNFIQERLDRRRPGQSSITTSRSESDRVELLSGIFEGRTLGTPIGFVIPNTSSRPADYDKLRDVCRPSHADYTYMAKYGHRDHRGGGRASARETACRVVAGAICLKALSDMGIEVFAYTSSIGGIECAKQASQVDPAGIETNPVRCPDYNAAEKMAEEIKKVRGEGDTLGGTVTCVIRGVPAGLGEPVGDKLHTLLGAAMLSINAVKGVEFGDGFAAAAARGSEMNDAFTAAGADGKPSFATNHSGGIQGGISNGADIVLRVAFKPVPTLMRPVEGALASDGRTITLDCGGRHDCCVVPRAVPVVEAMAAISIFDAILLNRSSRI